MTRTQYYLVESPRSRWHPSSTPRKLRTSIILSTHLQPPVILYIFCRFLDGDPKLTFQQWAAGLHLATMWGFNDIRNKIIDKMDKTISGVYSLDRIDAALKCRVRKWLHPAYKVLCKREMGLTDDEASRLGIQRSAAIWRIRESVLSAKAENSGRHQSAYLPKSRILAGAEALLESIVPRDARSQATSVDVMALIEREEALKYL